MKVATTAERLKQIMELKRLRQTDVMDLCQPYCNKYNVRLSKADLSQYVSGRYEPNQYRLTILGLALNVSEVWLMGYDVPMEREDDLPEGAVLIRSKDYPNILPVASKRIPMLGKIACGKPIYADEDRESYVVAGTDIQADFCLRASGDSMTGARIMDGDIVFIRAQDLVQNGEVAAVIINDEATLKRVYYYPDREKLVLQAENPRYEPLVFIGGELNDVHILGKAIAFQSDVR